ncbi:SELENOO [Branchiostoma lanceolatum]|uniref:Selenoprotein O n=1 Tax=Branchiostoma lanceolatum TaxID=7740 RepID=A0A8J9YTL0_BRALA|nr:SELENOO [Branchiostoma lanceolatum]
MLRFAKYLVEKHLTCATPRSTTTLACLPVQVSHFCCGPAAETGLKASKRKFFRRGRGEMATLETLNFDNLVLRSLPIDSSEENVPRQVPGACFSKVSPTPVSNPQTVAFSAQALQLLDLPASELTRAEFAEHFSGNKLLPGSETAAHCYCGHQFGHFSGQLGDGAAMYLGEVVNKSGERWEFQLKGAGLTPFSRTADGRKVLRSSIREFLCSEAMHHLGVPTTRAGSCVTSDSKVLRDVYYNGNASYERCTIVLRIAQTFLRFGSFEIFKPTDETTGRKGPSVGRNDILITMLDYAIKTFFPEIQEAHADNSEERYTAFFREVVHRTARLVAEWQCVGFCHGVLNTDNMSILGLTIDYGPFGFLDRYDADNICNGSDDGGRYSYRNQPEMCKWNCEKFAEAISEALPTVYSKPVLEEFDQKFSEHYLSKMRKKLGLVKKELAEDKELFEALLQTMTETGADFTNTLRGLSQLSLPGCQDFDSSLEKTKSYLLSQCCSVQELIKACKPRMDPRQLQMLMLLLSTNPSLLTQLGGQGKIMREFERMEKLEEIKDLTQEQKSAADVQKWTEWLEKYTARLKLEEQGAGDVEQLNKERIVTMNSNNPKFILRNYIAQNAITAAEEGDFSEVQRVLRLLEQPFSEDVDLGELVVAPGDGGSASTTDDDAGASASVLAETAATPGTAKSCTGTAYDSRPPDWAVDLCVT